MVVDEAQLPSAMLCGVMFNVPTTQHQGLAGKQLEHRTRCSSHDVVRPVVALVSVQGR